MIRGSGSKWMVYSKKADFKGIQAKYGIDQVIARIMRNRDVITDEDINMYLNGGLEVMHDALKMKDLSKAVDILIDKINSHKKIRIIGDYDIDGVCSITILYKAFKRAGADIDYVVPHRIKDGYGINEHLIDNAYNDGIDTIITCDNGIAAIDQINYGKSKGMTIIVTDHHDIPFEYDENGNKKYKSSEADAIVDPKQEECLYPFELLCGAGVAFKLVSVLYDRLGLDKEELKDYAEFMAIATVGDVVDLKDENRVIVKYGLKHIAVTRNKGLRALIELCQLDITNLSAYHIGFVIGPCINASGRLETAKKSIELFLSETTADAYARATEIKELNDERKQMTEDEAEKAVVMVESSDMMDDNVLVVYLPDCHESIAGIIAGRLRERFYKPVLVITNAEDGAKGSGRSIDGYNMFEEISKCAGLLTKFGGHPMAAGLSLPVENIEPLRRQLNINQTLTDKDLTPVVWIDVPMPVGYVTMRLVEQLKVLEPFGKGNEKPIFADRNLTVKSSRIIGKNKNVLKMQLESEDGHLVDAIMFHVVDELIPFKDTRISMVYYPDINEFNGNRSLQFIVQEWQFCK